MVTTRQNDTTSVNSPKSPASTPPSSPSSSSSSSIIGKKIAMARPPARPRRIQKFAVRKHTTKFGKKNSNANNPNGETVEVVKMLTGILYLYRGVNPRAEFVRKV